jgi:hypothetical protein
MCQILNRLKSWCTDRDVYRSWVIVHYIYNIYSINIQYKYLTIRLRARGFYEVIVDEVELKPAANNLFVLVESEIKQNIALSICHPQKGGNQTIVQSRSQSMLVRGLCGGYYVL